MLGMDGGSPIEHNAASDGWVVCISAGRSTLTAINLVAIKPRNTNYNLSFVFLSLPGKTWPRHPFQRSTNDAEHTPLKSAPETKSKAMPWSFPGLGQKT